MFRKKIAIGYSEVPIMAVISIVVALVGSVFFGLILNLHDWYAFTIRAMIFVALGYWFAKHEGDEEYFENEENTPVKAKIIANMLFIVALSLGLLFFFGMVLAVPNLGIMTISCVIPFAIAIFAFTKWDQDEKTADHSADCPYEIEKDDENS